MFKTILKQVRQYKAAALLTPLWTTLEVIMGVLIPYVTASIIDKGIGAGSLPDVYRYGAMMIGIACLSLLFGILAGRFAAYSSTGLAANLRLAMYENIQRFSFSDIDKFSTAGLVTRMTTDVSSIQSAFQMLLRVSFRAPLNMVSALGMCFLIHKKLSIIFLVAMVVLSAFLTVLITRAAKLFKQILLKVDALNGVVQASSIFGALARGGVNIRFISQPSSEFCITIAVATADLPAAREALSGLYKDGEVSLDDAVDFVEDVCLLSVCGNGMKNVPGTSGRIYTALGAYGVNIISAAQGGDELTISFVIRAADRAAAEEALSIL